MIRRLIYLFGTLMVMLSVFAACQDQEVPSSGNEKEVPEGYIAVKFKLDIPEMQEVQVRAADPDGINIHNLSLYCFNEYGLYIGYVQADDFTADDTDHSGTFNAMIPEDTKIIHFLGNQNNNLYDHNQLRGKSEDEVIAAMEGGSGMIVYWGRFKYNSTQGTTLKQQLENYSVTVPNSEGTGNITIAGIPMIRNQAMITTVIGNHSFTGGGSGSFTVTGFRTVNVHAFGTVAPYCPEHGFDMVAWPCTGEPFVTLPVDLTMMSDIEDINTKAEDYVFEHENSLENPVSVIIKGYHNNENAQNAKYYRVLLVDESGNQLMIRRNHKYIINIVGRLSYGQDTFAEALEAPATNNVWVSVDSWVNEVHDENFTLSVEKTSVVFAATDVVDGQELELKYTLTKKASDINATDDKPEVTWLDGNTVAYEETFDNTNHTFVQDDQQSQQGNGTIKINLRAMTDVPQHVGTLMIRKGKLYRTIEVVVIHTQTFVPSWLSSQIYHVVGSTDESRAHATLKFTIPETCPESLFPFPVLISVNSLDVRSEAGMELPVVIKGDEQYFGDNYSGIEYKYVYTVDKPGVHRVYFENILSNVDNAAQNVYLEAKHFETLTKTIIYSENQYAITLPSLLSWRPTIDSGTEYHEDDYVYYRLVPQKKGAKLDLNLTLTDLSKTPGNNTGYYMDMQAADEFMLYSKTLDFESENPNFDHNFVTVQNSTTGRIQAFWPKSGYTKATGTNGYALNLVTNASRSADVVRIASNHSDSPSLHNSGNYTGREYRDIIFELANYRPFGFAAQVTYPDPANLSNTKIAGWESGDSYGQDDTSSYVEDVDDVELPYQAPGQEVTISFDVTNFTSGTGTNAVEVDPFGREFKIYIDAPMLKLAADLGVYADKIVEDATKPGRFIYTVAAYRHTEATVNSNVNSLQSNIANERKSIPFVTRTICSSGEITLSSQEEEVVFYKKTFKVSNRKITGTIKYKEGTTETNVPKDAFVAFIHDNTQSRIGVMTITSDGNYSLNLRSEYDFDWGDNITLNYKNDDNYYEYKTTLSGLSTFPNVVLNLDTTP